MHAASSARGGKGKARGFITQAFISLYPVSLHPIPPRHNLILLLRERRDAPMLQTPREVLKTRRRPHSAKNIPGLKWHILRVIIQQHMIQTLLQIILEYCRPFPRTLIPHIALSPRPLPKQTIRSNLLVHLQRRLVLEETCPVAGFAEVLELLIYEGCVVEG